MATVVNEVFHGVTAASRYTMPAMFAVVAALLISVSVFVWDLVMPERSAARCFRAAGAADALIRRTGWVLFRHRQAQRTLRRQLVALLRPGTRRLQRLGRMGLDNCPAAPGRRQRCQARAVAGGS